MKKQNKKIVCKDGFEMSVQASEYTYCTPRIDNALHYEAAEVGYPSQREDLLMPYIDGDPEHSEPTNTVYGYVPSQIIVDVCAKHGGIVEGELPPGIAYLRTLSE